jgi:WD40 repeat protein
VIKKVDEQQFEKNRQQLHNQTPLAGYWMRRSAAGRLIKDASSETIRVLAEELPRVKDPAVRNRILSAFRNIKNQNDINNICVIWQKTHQEHLGRLIKECRWIASYPVDLRVFTALKSGQKEKIAGNGAEIVAPLLAACNDMDGWIRGEAVCLLGQLKNQAAINEFCESWAQERSPLLTEILLKSGYIASEPAALKVLTALKNRRSEKIPEYGEEAIVPLLKATDDADREIVDAALNLLRETADPGWRESVCNVFINTDYPFAREAVIAAGYEPKDVDKRAIFYFLTDQYERYEGMDFDHSMLRTAYETVNEPMRQRIMERIRKNGNVDLSGVINHSAKKQKARTPTDTEWEVVIDLLSANNRYNELWALAFQTPIPWSAEIIKRLYGHTSVLASEEEIWRELYGLNPFIDREFLYKFFDYHNILKNHIPLNTPTFSPDGRTIATGSVDGTVRFWDVASGQCRNVLKDRTGYHMAFSPDSQTLATTGWYDNYNTVRLWDVASGQSRKILAGHTQAIEALSFSPDGQTLATWSFDNTVRLWDVAGGQCRNVLEGFRGYHMSFSPDGQTLATWSFDNAVRLWDIASGRCRKVIEGHTQAIRILAFSPDGRTLATGGVDTRLWDVASGECRKILARHTPDVYILAFSPDGQTLATVCWGKTIRLWDIASGQCRSCLEGHTNEINTLAFILDGQTLATGSYDKTIRLWDVASGECHEILEGGNEFVLSPDGQTLATVCNDGTVHLWDMLYNKPLTKMTHGDLERAEQYSKNIKNLKETQAWQFLATLLRYKFRHDIEIGETVKRVFSEFDIEIEPIFS